MNLNMKRLTVAMAAAGLMGVAGSAAAGNIFLTGHDDDFHQSADAKAAMLGALAFVKDGSALPVLTFDAGAELTSLLTSIGQAFINVDPTLATNVTAALFDHSLYSAFVVASVTSCGGCDNTPADIDNITAQSAAIATFFNAGGGIIGLAGANYANAYAYVPTSATNGGGNPPALVMLRRRLVFCWVFPRSMAIRPTTSSTSRARADCRRNMWSPSGCHRTGIRRPAHRSRSR